MMNTALLTDRYEYTMLDSLHKEGLTSHPAVFELFARKFPDGRRFGMVTGLARFVDALKDFDPAAEVDWLVEEGVISGETVDYLKNWKFTGDIYGIPEGRLYHPDEPVLTVVAPLGEGIILETLALSIYNHDSAISSAAARMVLAANGRPIIEMGSRRTHEESAVAVARSAYIAGFASTSNLEAGKRYGIPTVGTAAHALTLAHLTEADAFRAQIAAHGVGTTLLVDTYDIEQGIRTAIEVAGPELGAIRIDSGELDVEARKARALLDSLGATQTRITVTSDLDEYVMTALDNSPIDGYGAGTRVATGSGHPTAGMVYKLVDIDGRPVAKASASKKSIGGRNYPWTRGTEHGYSMTPELPEGAVSAHVHAVGTGATYSTEKALEEARRAAEDTLANLTAEQRKIAIKESE